MNKNNLINNIILIIIKDPNSAFSYEREKFFRDNDLAYICFVKIVNILFIVCVVNNQYLYSLHQLKHSTCWARITRSWKSMMYMYPLRRVKEAGVFNETVNIFSVPPTPVLMSYLF